MRQVRVQGCLPTLVALVVIVALGAVAVTAGLAVVLATAGLLLVLAAVRAVRRVLGGGVGPGAPGHDAPGRVEAVPPGWMERDGGPIVEAGARGAPAGEPPDRAGERDLPPRG